MSLVKKNSRDARAGAVFGENVVRMHGNKENYVAVDEQGTTINGPISFVAGGNQMRFAALWTMNSELLLSIPSTLATPTPVMIIDPPIKQVGNIVEMCTIMISMLSLTGG